MTKLHNSLNKPNFHFSRGHEGRGVAGEVCVVRGETLREEWIYVIINNNNNLYTPSLPILPYTLRDANRSQLGGAAGRGVQA